MEISPQHRNFYRATTAEDAAAAATIIAAAFSPLPACAWLVPDSSERVRILAAVFTITVEHALNFGVVDLLTQAAGGGWADCGIGTAVWFDRTRPVPDPPDYKERLEVAAGTRYPRFELLDRLFERHHPPGPHQHLAFMAAAPGRQGAGIGAALLERHHAELDDRQLPAYLEASSPDSARLYSRYGYAPSGPAFDVTDGATFHPMWRYPKVGDPA
jgi:GNAT superfamily N-acetyltransferase